MDRNKYNKLSITELQILWRGAARDVLDSGRPLREITAEISEFVGSGDELIEPNWYDAPLTDDGRVDGRKLAQLRKSQGQ